MTLPEIVLPKIVLPFDIPVLVHPLVVHFLIALPVVILLLELMNLMMKKKAVGGVSFLLIILTVTAAIGAYFTGLVDGKEAYPALSEVAKSALAEHKLLGTYLMLGSMALLFLKLLAMTGNKLLKALYIFALIAFVVVMFKQGKEGGELVYVEGLNVEAVKILDDKIFDLEEFLEDSLGTAKEKVIPVVEVKSEAPSVVEVPAPVVVETVPTKVIEAEVSAPKTPMPVVETAVQVQTPVETTPIETVATPVQTVESVAPQAVPMVAPVTVPAVETIPTPQ